MKIRLCATIAVAAIAVGAIVVPVASASAAHAAVPAAAVSADSQTRITGLSVSDGSTYGVGMPVSVTFDKPVADKAAVEKSITVTSTSGQQVVGHWFGPERLDFRPATYWEPGSRVTVDLPAAADASSPGTAGTQDATVEFQVGRSQISTVDAATHTMTVVRDGKVLRTLPVSAGSPATPTYDGRMVISEMLPEKHMDGATVGFTDEDGQPAYDIPDVPHAMRLSSSGTFIHGNYWAPKNVFGTTNTSHGCIGLSDVKSGDDPLTPAAWFYDNSLVGDVVAVKGSGDKTIAPDNGLSDWNLPWSAWVRGSATQA
ncbi:L,D-transpeptidase [Streptomyces erythrochromogenes]|uniref:L,D-transpeptidase n=1 Tax=Streptomyces erythrochromogenes TaxID=285574 RepID=UPI00341FEE24